MKEYFVIIASIIFIAFIIYDFLTNKLSEGSSIRSKAFKLVVYTTAILTIVQIIMNQISKLADY